MVTDTPEEDDNGLFTGKTIEEILPKSTRDNDLFLDDIFRHQKVNLGNCRRWSRHLVHEVPAATSSQRTDNNPSALSNIINHVRQLDLGEAEREMSVRRPEEKEGKQLPEMDERKQAGQPEDLEDLHRAWQTKTQNKKTEDFDNLAALTDENVQEKDKSTCRRMLNWVDNLVQEHYREKIGQTYRRELEEGDQVYSSKAERKKQRKREEYLYRDRKRKTIKGRLDAYWEEKREKKEALRKKEEERFEKWAAGHGAGVSTPDEPKKRMSTREKGFLRAKEFFVH